MFYNFNKINFELIFNLPLLWSGFFYFKWRYRTFKTVFFHCFPLQVLFNEQQSQYVKLDVVTNGVRPQKLQCMEGYGTTPSAGPHSFHFVKPCQVSGLLRLDKGTELRAVTGPSFSLHPVANHVFSIFKVNWTSELTTTSTQTHRRRLRNIHIFSMDDWHIKDFSYGVHSFLYICI